MAEGRPAGERPPTAIDPALDPCRHFTGEPTVRHAIIRDTNGGEVELDLPLRFLEDRADRRDGVRTTAQLLVVTLDTFEPLTRRQQSERNRQGLDLGFSILLRDTIAPAQIAALAARNAALGSGNPARPLSAFPTRPGAHGLTEVLPVDPPRFVRRDVFVWRGTGGAVEAVLSCRKPGTVLNPSCDHWFRAHGIDVKLNWRRAELPNWHLLQDNVVRFLTCARPTY